MRNLMPVKDHPDLARDMDTGMIVNINKDKYKQHLNMIERIKQDKEEISSLKNEVQEMKMMLQKLLENGTNG
jgi:hypothetical protein